MPIKPWKELSRETVFHKYSRKMVKVDFELPDGKVSDFYLKEEAHAAGALALTPDNQVILTRQFRPGPMKILYNIPGGYIEEGEDITEASLRELKEETGYTGDAQYIGGCYGCAYSSVIKHISLVTNCKQTAGKNLDEHEDIEVELVSIEQFRDILRSGQMTDVHLGYMALDFAGLL